MLANLSRTKNSRLLAELRELDSYDTDSDSDDDDLHGQSLRQKEFENSLTKMGHALTQAARSNPLKRLHASGAVQYQFPQITLCLTRLDPSTSGDPRVEKTVQILKDMGIDVRLGERALESAAVSSGIPMPLVIGPRPQRSTTNVNLDLSLLIALVSDLTHTLLPTTVDEAESRFLSQRKSCLHSQGDGDADQCDEEDGDDLSKHSRALTNQLLQEMGKGMLQSMKERIGGQHTSGSSDGSIQTKFWTTPEARDRCMSIVAKIGGAAEQRRAAALFSVDGEDDYWRDSRFPHRFIPLLPIHILSTNVPEDDSQILPDPIITRENPFLPALADTCKLILSEEHSADVGHISTTIERALPMKANSKLTAHTVRSLLWGAQLGWTTLTANRTSIKAIVREMTTRRANVVGASDATVQGDTAAIWVVDPRSLAEGLRQNA